jgi:hypothetical protein
MIMLGRSDSEAAVQPDHNASTADSPVLIHVGYYKTGTTFLQEDFFARHPHINFVGCSSGNYHPEELLKLIYSPPQVWRKSIALSLAADRPNVISFESFSGGSLWQGGGGMSIDERTASRLKNVFPRARILIVIREQFTMLKSVYWQYVWEGGTLSFGGFVDRSLADPLFFSPYQLAYDELSRRYQDLFGSESVLVLPFERLLLDRGGFVATVNRFMGVPDFQPEKTTINASPGGALAFFYVRLINRVFGAESPQFRQWSRTFRQRLLRPWRLLGLIPIRQRYVVSDAQQEALAAVFRPSNQACARQTGIDLAALGYVA